MMKDNSLLFFEGMCHSIDGDTQNWVPKNLTQDINLIHPTMKI